MRLPDDAEVSNELWDEVVDHMKLRVQDKVPLIRMFAVRALSRFANDSENSDILDLFLEVLTMEQNAVSMLSSLNCHIYVGTQTNCFCHFDVIRLFFSYKEKL